MISFLFVFINILHIYYIIFAVQRKYILFLHHSITLHLISIFYFFV